MPLRELQKNMENKDLVPYLENPSKREKLEKELHEIFGGQVCDKCQGRGGVLCR